MRQTLPACPGSADESFERQGYVVLEGFVADRELADLRADVERRLARPLPPGCERPHNTLAPLCWEDRPVDRVLADAPRIDRLRQALAAGDLRWISAYVSVKPARSAPLWWHQDWWCWDHPVSLLRPAPQVAVLCYLSETDELRGALRVMPGSHSASLPLHAALPEAHADNLELSVSAAAFQDQPGQATVCAGAGDAVVVDYRLLHGTHANRAPERRDCLVLTFTPCWGDLPQEIRGHLIQHPALPDDPELVSCAWGADLLPRFDGPRTDLRLNRIAPPEFVLADGSAAA